MAYIYTDHSVGATRYVYNPCGDIVARVTVVGIVATCEKPGDEFVCRYRVKDGNGLQSDLDGDKLHRSASDAFPVPGAYIDAA